MRKLSKTLKIKSFARKLYSYFQLIFVYNMFTFLLGALRFRKHLIFIRSREERISSALVRRADHSHADKSETFCPSPTLSAAIRGISLFYFARETLRQCLRGDKHLHFTRRIAIYLLRWFIVTYPSWARSQLHAKIWAIWLRDSRRVRSFFFGCIYRTWKWISWANKSIKIKWFIVNNTDSLNVLFLLFEVSRNIIVSIDIEAPNLTSVKFLSANTAHYTPIKNFFNLFSWISSRISELEVYSIELIINWTWIESCIKLRRNLAPLQVRTGN